jgi:hypothetical protein
VFGKIDPIKLKIRLERRKNNKLRSFKRMQANKKEKLEFSLFSAIKRIKEVAEPEFFSSKLGGCLRASFGMENKAESNIHRLAKYLDWEENRIIDAVNFDEIILKNNMGRPDRIWCFHNGTIIIHEFICSEKEKSIKEKENKYPFPIKWINCEEHISKILNSKLAAESPLKVLIQ